MSTIQYDVSNTIVTASTVVLGMTLAAYHTRCSESVAAAAGLLAALSALQLASPNNTKIMKGVAASVWGYLSHKMFSA